MSQREFVPAAGHDVFLPLYDPLVNLMGFDRARRDLISGANIEPDHRILDLGCGTGSLVVNLKRQYVSAQVVGLDPDPKALRRARTKAVRAASQINFLTKTSRSTTFSPRSCFTISTSWSGKRCWWKCCVS